MSICKDRKTPLLFCTLAVLAACDPYLDQGEFLAGPVFAANFLAGIKPQGDGSNPFSPIAAAAHGKTSYSVIATKGTSTTVAATATPATSPLWTDGKRDPLAVSGAQQVYAFDGPCQAPEGYSFDPNLDLIRKDMQYPVFQDLPEILPSGAGKPGRNGPYSAIVQVIHLSVPAGFPCQAVKRFSTAQARAMADLHMATTEYRLYQIFDLALTKPPTPYLLGFFDQLLVPYIDMGPVPVSPDGKSFLTMPIYHLVDAMGMPSVDSTRAWVSVTRPPFVPRSPGKSGIA